MGRVGGRISLTQAGFMLIAPLFVTAYHAAEARSEDWFAYRREEDSNPQPRIGQKLSNCGEDNMHSVTQLVSLIIQAEEHTRR